MPIIVLAAVGLALLQSSAVDVSIDEDVRLEACVDRLETDPSGAYEDGLAWIYQGNRPKARQCTALALVALGRAGEGAARLEQLANATDGGTLEERALYLTQAGNAWLQAGAPEAAAVTFTNAIKLRPTEPDLLIDRASAHLMQEHWQAGADDLDAALELAPGLAIAHQLRAEARLNLGQLDAALEDVQAAMAAEPENVDVLVLRGRVREAIRLSELRLVD